MNNKPLAILSPLCLALYAAGAQAALEPFSFDVSETLKHESNIAHQQDQFAHSDWISNSEVKAAIDEALGRGKLGVDAGVNYNRYEKHVDRALNAWGYHAGAQLDWETIGDLSGAFGGDTSRRQYMEGVTADTLPLPGQTTPQTVIERNMQTDDHAFARIQLGGPSRWQIFGGGDFNKRRFSSSNFSSNDERQWSANFGTRYATSPDLVFGLVGNTTRGEFPHVATFSFGNSQSTEVKRFHTRSINGTVQLKATGNSEFDASLGYTKESSDLLESHELKFVNGSLNWTWTPPSHFTVKLGLKRSTDYDTSTTGMNNGVRYANGLNSPSVNNLALLDVTYALTAKVNLDANATYSQRKYSDIAGTDPQTHVATVASGDLRTTTLFFTAHWQPTRTTDVSCGAGRERRSGPATFAQYTYSDNTVRCTAAIKFD